ncbi:protein glutamate methylesterase CheB and methyltransferase CheR [Geotalea daltonii FRC-32]|uniref:protein-glutamate O-methyltransferase n=1 Tax=Geotalea daltonii (strain DSM 22248 / JCM 15807 / FRC-32) TaxID=316067 RepID=B9M7M1_GEODF|nr:chemotaxis protein CheB [Geotalea daltonii]ACM22127.1 protein glutamate methylesterase CheB and methyltransferase CheR [Geotalea daltonii FRC-32]
MKKQPQPANSDNERTRSQEEIPSRAFPIVGIGASAGGLEALEQFLGHVPENSDMAFVIVQHLDPTHKGVLPELLQHTTGMEVFQVVDRMRVKTNCVYVIPPNKDMSMLHGVLHLFEPTAPRGLRLPIDFFLRSLAEDRQEHSIGVILSGMGSDGTMGLRAIKEKAGLTLVQEPASARFDSMPRSAIDAGLADIIAPAEELPGKIFAYLRHLLIIGKPERPLEEKDQSALEKVLILLRDRTGHDFSMYKKNTVYRRIERRMGIHQIDRIAAYVRYLQENSQEVELLFKELLIGVTSFFRDPAAWEQLQGVALPAILAGRPAGCVLRAWSAGCSTGEEAYSLAIVFKEVMGPVTPAGKFTLQIFATDLDPDAIDKARQGLYPANIAADISPERLHRFFIKEENGYRVGKEIREMVTFATQNVIMDPPFTKLDILICRNLLIYLTPELQKKLMPLFHYSLNPGGVLFLGSAETAGTFAELFAPLNIKSRLFRRRESVSPCEPLAFPVSFAPTQQGFSKEQPMLKPSDLQSLADQVLLQHFTPPAVLVNDKGDILYISGKTGRYLEPAAGKANWNIFAMAREGLRLDLSSAFQKAIRQKKAITAKGLKVGTNGSTQTIDLTVQAIEEPEALRGMVMVVFNDVATLRGKKPSFNPGLAANVRVLELEQELQHCREELQTTREEMQSSQEELRSTNEELQSANEELITSREEMQSMNEELQTVNAEQQSKMDELSRVNDDMRNLLNSTEIITVFLDKELHIRRFTTGVDKIFKLIPGDVGRPLSDIVSDLLYSRITEDAREVLRTLAFSEKQIAATDGRWFSVRIMPYRTMEDVIDGVVITFADITVAKTLEAELREEVSVLRTKSSK